MTAPAAFPRPPSPGAAAGHRPAFPTTARPAPPRATPHTTDRRTAPTPTHRPSPGAATPSADHRPAPPAPARPAGGPVAVLPRPDGRPRALPARGTAHTTRRPGTRVPRTRYAVPTRPRPASEPRS